MAGYLKIQKFAAHLKNKKVAAYLKMAPFTNSSLTPFFVFG
jgi:hypothetical protein